MAVGTAAGRADWEASAEVEVEAVAWVVEATAVEETAVEETEEAVVAAAG